MILNKAIFNILGLALISATLTSCFLNNSAYPTAESPGKSSTKTNLEYNEEGGFEVSDYAGQPEAPDMVYIEGGRTVLGAFEEDVLYARNNIERTVTVASFFMDKSEVGNVHYLEYLFYVKRDSSREKYEASLPDTLVWESELAFNDPYRDHYLRYPGFRFYPVVGVSWLQATDYCKWRTQMVNVKLAEDAGIDLPAEADTESTDRIPLESGIVIPAFRLPTEAEWEYAALGLIDTQYQDENQTHQRIFPWDGHSLRNAFGKKQGTFYANFKRGRGDYAGIAGKLNDGAMITNQIYSGEPNGYGLYNMAGNVNEWVFDLYRALSFQDMDDLNPVRRDDFLDSAENYDYKNSNSLINNKIRVYKGGSWKDVAHWLAPGTRRFIDQDSSTATIGFRCAMINAGRNY